MRSIVTRTKARTANEIHAGKFGPGKARTMLSMPNLTADQFRDLVQAYGGRARVAKDFCISADLVNAYWSQEIEPPLTLLLAIYWQGPDGFNHAFCESDQTNVHNFAMRRLAEEKADKVLAMVDRVVVKLGVGHQVTRLLVTAKERALSGAPLWMRDPALVDPSRAGQSPERLKSMALAERLSRDPLAGESSLI